MDAICSGISKLEVVTAKGGFVETSLICGCDPQDLQHPFGGASLASAKKCLLKKEKGTQGAPIPTDAPLS